MNGDDLPIFDFTNLSVTDVTNFTNATDACAFSAKHGAFASEDISPQSYIVMYGALARSTGKNETRMPYDNNFVLDTTNHYGAVKTLVQVCKPNCKYTRQK